MSDPNGVRRQALRFLIVGGANTLITYLIFILLGLVMPAWLAYTIAFAAGLAWVVFGSSRFVFMGDHGTRRLLLFAAWYLVIYAIGRVIIYFIAPADFVGLLLASLAVLVVTTPLTFIGGRYVFAPLKQQQMTDATNDAGRSPEILSRSRQILVRGGALLASHKGAPVVAGLIAFVVVCSRGPAVHFIYDAMVYWISSLTLVSGGDTFGAGGLALRGAITPVIYVPAAVATSVFGAEASAPAVLVQNALLIAVLGAVVVPALVRLFVTVHPIHVYVSAVLTAFLLRGFGPYPLVDLWALTFVLLGILLVGQNPRWYSLVIGGLLLGIAFNVRPAYVIPVILILLSWGVFHRFRALWALPAAAIALVPQVVVNLINARSFAPWPINSFVITEVQAKYASFVVRYDTLGYVPDSKVPLFYCSPGMAERFVDGTPKSSVELAGAFLQHLPASLKFVAEKVSASLGWTSATPYSLAPNPEISALAAIVVGVCSVGLLGLIWFWVRRSAASRSGAARLVVPLLALWFGSVATLAFSTPEARFALPLVLVGLVGCIVLAAVFAKGPIVTRAAIVWGVASLLLAVAVLLIGQMGLSHPAEPDDVTPRICSAG